MKIGSLVKVISTTTPFLFRTIGMYGCILGVEDGAYLVQLPQRVNNSTRWMYQPYQLRDVDYVKYPEDSKQVTELLIQNLTMLSYGYHTEPPKTPEVLKSESAEDLLKEALELLGYAFEWIDAVPEETPLPAMPGFDRDWADGVIDKIKKRITRQN